MELNIKVFYFVKLGTFNGKKKEGYGKFIY
jgi:hypothetical protein